MPETLQYLGNRSNFLNILLCMSACVRTCMFIYVCNCTRVYVFICVFCLHACNCTCLSNAFACLSLLAVYSLHRCPSLVLRSVNNVLSVSRLSVPLTAAPPPVYLTMLLYCLGHVVIHSSKHTPSYGGRLIHSPLHQEVLVRNVGRWPA